MSMYRGHERPFVGWNDALVRARAGAAPVLEGGRPASSAAPGSSADMWGSWMTPEMLARGRAVKTEPSMKR